MDVAQDQLEAAPVADRRERRARDLAQRRHRRQRSMIAAVAGVAVLATASVVAGIVVGNSLVRSGALGDYESSASRYASLSKQTTTEELAASITGVRGALAVSTDLESAGSVEALATAAGAAEDALVRLTAAKQWTADIEPATADADLLVSTAVDADARRSQLVAAQDAAAKSIAALESARKDFAAAILANGLTVLSDYSDAERSTEDAFHTALEAVATVPAKDLPAALTAVETTVDAVRASALDYRAEIAAKATGRQPTGGDVSAQLDYLLTHATSYNLAAWGDYNPSGGDCVNFTSQGLLARGWQMDRTWRSTGPGGASKTWILTPAMDAYLEASGFVSHGADDLDRVRVGDIGIFDWGENGRGEDHTMTVSRVEYTVAGPTVWFVSHNADGQYRELRKALDVEHSGSTVKIYSIP